MISQKFSNLSNDAIVEYISDNKEAVPVFESVESVSDLWVLANMKDTFDEENNIHSSVADTNIDMLPTGRGGDAPGYGHRVG